MKDVHHLQRSKVCEMPTSVLFHSAFFLLLPPISFFYAFHLLQTSVNPSSYFLISLSPFSCYINSAYRSVLSFLFWQVKAFHRGHKNVLLTPCLFEIHSYVNLFPTSWSSKLTLQFSDRSFVWVYNVSVRATCLIYIFIFCFILVIYDERYK